MNSPSHIKVGIVIATLEVGGAERMALAVARALLDADIEVFFYCVDPGGDMPLPGTPEQQEELAKRIRVINRRAPSSTLAKAMAFPAALFALERSFRRDRVDLVISFMERANLLNLLGNRGIPRIISIRKHLSMALQDKDPLKRWLVRNGYRLLLSRAHTINLNSAEAAVDLRQLFPDIPTPSVINNFYDQQMLERSLEPLPSQQAEQLSANTVITCGRLVRVKRHDALIRAFAVTATRHPEARLVIVGEGPERANLTRLIKDLKLEQQVYLAGFQSNPWAWIARCKIFVLSSRAEGFPNALLEAMALGRPVISADCRSGPRELLAPATDPAIKTRQTEFAPYGILTPPLDTVADTPAVSPAESALAEAMTTLLADDTLCNDYGKAARQRANNFERNAILQQWLQLVSQYDQPTGSGHSDAR